MGTWMGGARNHNESDERLSRHWQQLLRLTTTVRINDDKQTAIERIINALPIITGFETAMLFLASPDSEILTLAGAVGVTTEDCARLMATPATRQQALALLTPERALRSDRSYRVRSQQASLVEALSRAREPAPGMNGRADTWTALDTLLVPLYDQRKNLIGLIVLDTPMYPRHLQNGMLQGMLDVIESSGDFIVTTLENAQAYQQLTEAHQQTGRDLTTMKRQFEQVQQGDYTVTLTNDESSLLDIAAEFHGMLRHMSNTLAGVRSTSQIINESATTAWNLANDAKRKAQMQTQQIEQAETAITSVATSIEDMAQVSETAWTVAGNAREFSQAGRSSVEDAVMGMDGVRQVALQSSQRVKRLAESLQEIETIVQQVSDFSNKTNLLAINSSIEAARAGDFGRGFTIIAQEIRTLALNSADAANQIATRIKTIQSEASAVVIAIAEGTERVVEQSDRIVDAGAALLVIDEVTEQIATLNESIRTIAQEESAQTSILTTSLHEISSLTETTRDSVQHIATAMTDVVDFAAALGERIMQFKLRGNQGG